MTVPDGAQVSDDGKYWWDGSDWQPVPEDGGATEVGQLSDDGQWKWDGSEWQPVSADSSSSDSSSSGLKDALAAQGLEVPDEAADADYVKQVVDHVSNWYSGLDADSQAIVDALSKQGADTLLADPEVGVVSENDPLITAFAGTDKTLGESLEATNQALEQAQN